MKFKAFFLMLLVVVLPNCIFRKSSRKFDCARATYENVLYKYDRELQIFNKMDNCKDKEESLRLGHELKDDILLKNEEFNDERCHKWFKQNDQYANYPFTQYKLQLDCDIDVLEQAKNQLYWKQEGLGKSVQDLINQLDRLRRYIVLSADYSQERRMMERRKILELEKTESQKQVVRKKRKKTV